MRFTVWKTELSERQLACRRADVVVPIFMIDVVVFTLGRVSTFFGWNILSSGSLLKNDNVRELQVRFDLIRMEVVNVNSHCNS